MDLECDVISVPPQSPPEFTDAISVVEVTPPPSTIETVDELTELRNRGPLLTLREHDRLDQLEKEAAEAARAEEEARAEEAQAQAEAEAAEIRILSVKVRKRPDRYRQRLDELLARQAERDELLARQAETLCKEAEKQVATNDLDPNTNATDAVMRNTPTQVGISNPQTTLVPVLMIV